MHEINTRLDFLPFLSLIVMQRVTQASCGAAKSILTFPLLQHGLLFPAAPHSSLPLTSPLLHAALVAKVKAGGEGQRWSHCSVIH